MSATPRPWTVELDNEIDLHVIAGADADGSIGAVYNSAEDAQFLVRAVNAFATLLAVAQAAARPETNEHDISQCRLCRQPSSQGHSGYCSLFKLDTLHPGWREWTP